MDPTPLDLLRSFCSRLTFAERKALITLARSQSVPDRVSSPILFSKVAPVLDRIVLDPPFENLSQPLYPEGEVVIRLLASSLTTGILIVYALGVSLSDEQVEQGRRESFTKELLATQTRRLPSQWNWKALIYHAPRHSEEIIHPLFPRRSRLHNIFASGVSSLLQRYRHRVVLPHYSKRGISSQTAALLLSRVKDARVSRSLVGPPRTFHRQLDRRNVTSRDVVHHYVRSGEWIAGKTEMKQRWYPSGLLPRTYFSWGGTDIALSCYLRNFFNDLGDCFPSTQRHNRVQPDWLQNPTRTHDGGYVFYDLTSFTSWFHEHHPFLLAIAERCKGVTVFLTGYDLSVSSHDLGDMISAYAERVNNFPSFIVNGSYFGLSASEDREFRHLCAGFLGIPGNLITCTLPHALAQAVLFDHERELQVPGDDVGAACRDDDHRRDIGCCASTLGVLQFDKVYSTYSGVCIYLKRLVLDLGTRITLAPMLIYPLLPYLINPEGSYRSNQFRLPEPKESRSRAARVLVAFQRDIWKMTKGDLDSDTEEIITVFIRRVHEMVGLPLSAIFQGRLYGVDDEEDDRFPDITVKFAADDPGFLRRNPDLDFAGKYVTRMTIRATAEVPITPPFSSLQRGETVIVQRSKAWSFLEDMGYVRVVGIPGEKLELIGSDARDAYLFAAEPPLREVEVLCDIDTWQLVGAGVLRDGEGVVFSAPQDDSDSRHVDVNSMSWRYRKYVDLDDPKGSTLYGKTREWCVDKISSTRESLSPEPDNPFLEY